jgi:hypothetical protein
MLLIKIVLASVFFTFYFIEMARIPEKIKLLKRKPFNCPMCLSVYVACILFFVPVLYTHLILVMFTAGIAAPFIRNFLTNLMFKK